MRQKVAIALALARDVPVLLLDEPTSGVSVDEKIEMMERVIEPLKADDATLLFIEHDMDIVTRFAERTVAFYEGKILSDGPTAEVLADTEVRRYVIGGVHA